mmetsp:Transcript_28999/g.70034  ORF Transcript_28999/g.70034 Transcript_28999/m.70034 type:complete len:233 (+) Transcript_28999:1316-2014(+)
MKVGPLNHSSLTHSTKQGMNLPLSSNQFQNIMAISRILTTGLLLVTLCSFATASTRHHVSKDNGGVQSLDSPVKDQFRSLRRRPSRQFLQKKDLPWWKLSHLQNSSTNARKFGNPSSAATAAPITSATSSPVVHFTSAPTVSPTKSLSDMPSLAPSLTPTDGPTKDPTAAPTKSPTIAPSASPSVPPTTVEFMDSALQDEASAKFSKTIFVSVFLGVYVVLGGGIAIRWLWC